MALPSDGGRAGGGTGPEVGVVPEGGTGPEVGGREGTERVTDLGDGDIVIAAITSCTNTSNPYVLAGAGLLAAKALEKGLAVKPWVKASLAPGSRVVASYLEKAGLLGALDTLGFKLVGFGCTTCIGNSGPLVPGVAEAVSDGALSVCAVLSGNRNFEGRIHADVRMNYLASPPLVVAYALAGSMNVDLASEPLGYDPSGEPVRLRDIWPSDAEISATVLSSVGRDEFTARYASVYDGDHRWEAIDVPLTPTFRWQDGSEGTAKSTYVLRPPFFEGMDTGPQPLAPIEGARILALLGDSVTTDHISPAGSIKPASPAGSYLQENGVAPADFNSYGSRRGNHEVMMRGTFANTRLHNLMLPGSEGGVTMQLPNGEEVSIFDAAMRYEAEGVPLVIVAGKEYGSGSSRDWAGKGPALLGIRAVIAESFERIHRSNLVGMGILPLQFPEGTTAASLTITGREVVSIPGIAALAHTDGDWFAGEGGGDGYGATADSDSTRGANGSGDATDSGREGKGTAGGSAVPATLEVKIGDHTIRCRVRIDTPQEANYYRHGGILRYVLRQLASSGQSS